MQAESDAVYFTAYGLSLKHSSDRGYTGIGRWPAVAMATILLAGRIGFGISYRMARGKGGEGHSQGHVASKCLSS